MMTHEERAQSRKADFGLGRFESISLLRGAAALTIWPPNADRAIALDQLSGTLLRPRPGGGVRVHVTDWRRWLTSGASRVLRDVEPDGVCDSPSCVPAALLGDRYELIGGFLDAPDLMMSVWADALGQARDGTGDAVVDGALSTLLAAAAISDRVSGVAGIGGHVWPDHDVGRAIRVPGATEYARLIRAVTFSRIDRGELGPGIEALMLGEDLGALWKPLMPWRGGFIVVRPARLLVAALVSATRALSRSSASERVLISVAASAVGVVETAARDMDWQVEGREGGRVHLRIDRDCRALVDVSVLVPGEGDLGEVEDARPALESIFRSQAKLLVRREHQLAFVCVVGSGRSWGYEQPRRDGSEAVPIVMRIGDFRLLGDALRREPLGLVRVLERIPSPPWPRGHSMIDMIGIERALEEIEPRDDGAKLDGVEYLHRRARVMALRHPAPAPDGDGWISVTRWGGSPDGALFAEESGDGAALLVRTPGSFIWVVAADPTAGRYHISRAVLRLVAFWFARLRDAGWSMLYDSEYAIRVTVEFDGESPTPLSIRTAPGGARVRFGRELVSMVCRGDNTADRLLVTGILEWWGVLPQDGIERLRDALVPEGRGTFMLWPSPDVDENTPRLLPPDLVTGKELREIERWLVAGVIGEHEAAIVQADHAPPFLKQLIEALVRLIEHLLEPLGESALIDLIAVNERAAYQAEAESVLLPARAAIDRADEYFGDTEAIGERGPALRGLIERAAAKRPSGNQRLSLRAELRLRAAHQLLVRWGGALEAVNTGLATCEIAMSHVFGIAVAVQGPIRVGSEGAADQLLAAAPQLMAAHHSDWWSGDPVPDVELDLRSAVEIEHPLWIAVNDAMKHEWGFTYEQSVRLMRAASDLADAGPGAVAVVARRDLTEQLAAQTSIGAAAVEAFIARHTLTQESAYDPLARDHRPWETNRPRSYLQRPFVDVGDNRIAFSRHHLLTAAEFMHRLIESGRLRSEGRLFSAIRQLSASNDRDFEQEVQRRCETLGFKTALRVKRLGGRAIEKARGQTLGDIDVLAWSHAQRRVLLLDAKRMAPGLPPFAMRRHRDALIKAAARHRRRLDWVLAHRAALKRHTSGEFDERWTVEAALVLAQALPGAEMEPLAVAAWPVWELDRRLSDDAALT